MPGIFSRIFSYSFFNILNAVIPFLLLPFLTNSLGPEGYGIVAMFTIIVSFLIPITGLSVNSAITKQFYFLDEQELKVYISNCTYILIASVIVLSVIILIIGDSVYHISQIPSSWILKAVLISMFIFGHSILLILWQVRNKPIYYGLFQIFNSLLNLGLTFFFIEFYHLGWKGRLNAWLISSAMMFLFASIVLYSQKMLFQRIDLEKAKHALKFGLPLIPHAIGGLLIAVSDRMIISSTLNIHSTGIYTVAFQFASILGVLMNGLNTAFVPWLFENLRLNSELIMRKIVTFTYITFIIIFLSVLIGNFIIEVLFDQIIDKKFLESRQYIFILLLAFGFNGMYLMVTNYLFFTEKTHLLAISTFIISIFNIPLCFYLTSWYGLKGATYSTAIAYFLLFIVTWQISSKSFKMPWKKPYIFK